MAPEEIASYHGLAILLGGEYQKLKKEWELHGSWQLALKERDRAKYKTALRDFLTLEAAGIRVIMKEDPLFPEALREIPWPPFALYIRGIIPKTKEVCVAIVGTRKATLEGKKFAEKIAISLAQAEVTVVSGLALGVDAAAQGAVSSREFRTIGVLASGVDKIYPRENEKIGAQILSTGGALISEYPPGSPALPRRFLERNRIVAGLSKGVVVIEAPKRSGSLATANFALEQNREVFVSPGFPEHPNYEGSHALLKSGACLITSANDVLEALGIALLQPISAGVKIPADLDANEKTIINVLMSSGVPMGSAAISEETGIDPAEVNAALGTLVIQGLLEDRSGIFAVSNNGS
ncbi:MAG: DNA-processing protein DprA [Patescibacteria group bacterium]